MIFDARYYDTTGLSIHHVYILYKHISDERLSDHLSWLCPDARSKFLSHSAHFVQLSLWSEDRQRYRWKIDSDAQTLDVQYITYITYGVNVGRCSMHGAYGMQKSILWSISSSLNALEVRCMVSRRSSHMDELLDYLSMIYHLEHSWFFHIMYDLIMSTKDIIIYKCIHIYIYIVMTNNFKPTVLSGITFSLQTLQAASDSDCWVRSELGAGCCWA